MHSLDRLFSGVAFLLFQLAMGSFYEGDPEDDELAGHSVQETERLGQPEASHSEQMGSGHITSKKKSPKKPANSRFVFLYRHSFTTDARHGF